MNRIISSILICTLMLAVAVGCGKGSKVPTVKWSGTVTINGAAIPSDAQGTIAVRSTNNTGASVGDQAEIVNGKYSLQNVPKGEVVVTFDICTLSPAKDPSDAERGVMDTTNLVPERWLQGVVEKSDKNDSAKNFDLTE